VELKLLGVAAKVGGGQLASDDFAVAARWGIAGKGGITMPSSGDAREREFSAVEAAALGESAVVPGCEGGRVGEWEGAGDGYWGPGTVVASTGD